jgi:hypothetical protein
MVPMYVNIINEEFDVLENNILLVYCICENKDLHAAWYCGVSFHLGRTNMSL